MITAVSIKMIAQTRKIVIMSEHLQIWYDKWLEEHKETDLIYAKSKDGPRLQQVHFIRDDISALFWAGISYYDRPKVPPPRSDCRESAVVISEHRSKSVRLPVYSLTRMDIGLQLTLRDNYYNWKLSVDSKTPITADFSGLFHTTPPIEPDYTGDPLNSVYFEGFPESRVFGYFSDNNRQFSAEIHSSESLWTAVFLMMRGLGMIKPFEWHTRESHKKALDEQSARWKRENDDDEAKKP